MSTGCLPCACYKPGTVPGAMCHPTTGRCTCIEGAGDPAVTNHKCVSTHELIILIFSSRLDYQLMTSSKIYVHYLSDAMKYFNLTYERFYKKVVIALMSSLTHYIGNV